MPRHGLGITDEELLSLPMRDHTIRLPDGSIDWRFYVPTGNFWPTPDGWKLVNQASSSGVMAWIQSNQTIVFAASGALLLLALMGRRR